MKKQLLIGATILLCASSTAWAADNASEPAAMPAPTAQQTPAAMAAPSASQSPAVSMGTPAPAAVAAPAPETAASGSEKPHHQRTLEEARKYAHERADKLDKMTPEEYAASQQKHREWLDKWKHMTPEEKEAYKKEHHGKRHSNATGAAPASSAPASGGQ